MFQLKEKKKDIDNIETDEPEYRIIMKNGKTWSRNVQKPVGDTPTNT